MKRNVYDEDLYMKRNVFDVVYMHEKERATDTKATKNSQEKIYENIKKT